MPKSFSLSSNLILISLLEEQFIIELIISLCEKSFNLVQTEKAHRKIKLEHENKKQTIRVTAQESELTNNIRAAFKNAEVCARVCWYQQYHQD